MAEEKEVFRVSIDGEWYASEMADLVINIEEYYSDFVLLHELLSLQESKETADTVTSIQLNEKISKIEAVLFTEEEGSRQFIANSDWLQDTRLQVKKIYFGSEGGWDFLGIGKAAKAVSDLISIVFEFVDNKQDRIDRCLKNAERAAKLAKKAGASEDQVRKMTQKALKKCGFLVELKEQQKLLPAPAKI